MMPRSFRSEFLPASLKLLMRGEPVILLLLGAVFALKVKMMSPVATDSFLIAVSQHDAVIFAAILLLYTVGSATIPPGFAARGHVGGLLTASARVLCLALIALYTIDVFVYYFFGTRLYVSDIVTFSSEIESAGTLVATAWRVMMTHASKITLMIIGLAVAFRACITFLARPSREKSGRKWALTASVLLLALYLIPMPHYVYAFGDKPLFENFIERNMSFFVQTNFSDDFRARTLASPPEEMCRAGAGLKLNVIVVIVESLSAYQSHAFSGIEDWTPRLDEIAAKETALADFHANGWTTIGGLISLLGGSYPFVPEAGENNKWGSPRLSDFMHLSDTLPQALAQEGYSTIFLSAGDLSFLGQGDWLRAIGFQHIVGEDDPRFDRQEVRGPFKSVPDEILYDVLLDEVRKQPPGGHYFITAQTFWSHRPFMMPDGTDVSGEEPVIRLTDQHLGVLYDRLMAEGFFENGILFLTGDHRALEPYRRAEIERFGTSAPSRVPAIVATSAVELPSVIAGKYQQRDLKVSIEALVRQRYCADKYEGAFLGLSPSPPACIMHAKGDDRDLVSVACGEKEATVRIAGDATRVVQGVVEDEAGLLQVINYARARPELSSPDSPEMVSNQEALPQ